MFGSNEHHHEDLDPNATQRCLLCGKDDATITFALRKYYPQFSHCKKCKENPNSPRQTPRQYALQPLQTGHILPNWPARLHIATGTFPPIDIDAILCPYYRDKPGTGAAWPTTDILRKADQAVPDCLVPKLRESALKPWKVYSTPAKGYSDAVTLYHCYIPSACTSSSEDSDTPLNTDITSNGANNNSFVQKRARLDALYGVAYLASIERMVSNIVVLAMELSKGSHRIVVPQLIPLGSDVDPLLTEHLHLVILSKLMGASEGLSNIEFYYVLHTNSKTDRSNLEAFADKLRGNVLALRLVHAQSATPSPRLRTNYEAMAPYSSHNAIIENEEETRRSSRRDLFPDVSSPSPSPSSSTTLSLPHSSRSRLDSPHETQDIRVAQPSTALRIADPTPTSYGNRSFAFAVPHQDRVVYDRAETRRTEKELFDLSDTDTDELPPPPLPTQAAEGPSSLLIQGYQADQNSSSPFVTNPFVQPF